MTQFRTFNRISGMALLLISITWTGIWFFKLIEEKEICCISKKLDTLVFSRLQSLSPAFTPQPAPASVPLWPQFF